MADHYNNVHHQGGGNPSRGGGWRNWGEGGRGRGAQFGTTTHAGRGRGGAEPRGDGNDARERAREQEVNALRIATKNMRTRLQMSEVSARSFAGKEAIFMRDRVEGSNIISQGRTKLGQAEKRIYELKKKLDDKQLLLSGMHAGKVHAENKAIKLEDALETLQGEYDHLWEETNRLFNHTSGKAQQHHHRRLGMTFSLLMLYIFSKIF